MTQGLCGPHLIKGPQGIKGDTGATGPTGPKGDSGAPGSKDVPMTYVQATQPTGSIVKDSTWWVGSFFVQLILKIVANAIAVKQTFPSRLSDTSPAWHDVI